jgi:hypothetical protein
MNQISILSSAEPPLYIEIFTQNKNKFLQLDGVTRKNFIDFFRTF